MDTISNEQSWVTITLKDKKNIVKKNDILRKVYLCEWLDNYYDLILCLFFHKLFVVISGI